MSKTMKQIADELHIDKQKVYRYIKKNHIIEAHQEAGVKHYSEAAVSLIKQGLSENTVSSEAHQRSGSDIALDAVIEMLRKELEAKNEQISAQQRQIEQLTSALEHTTSSLQAAQALHAGTIQKQLTDGFTLDGEHEPPKKWWQRRRKE